MAEAAKHNVLPLDDRFAERADPSLKPSHLRGKTHFIYPPGTVSVPERSSPYTKNRHHTIAADVDIPEGGSEGVLVCCGGLSGGFAVFMPIRKNVYEKDLKSSVIFCAVLGLTLLRVGVHSGSLFDSRHVDQPSVNTESVSERLAATSLTGFVWAGTATRTS